MQIVATFGAGATAGEEQAVNTAINYLDSHFGTNTNATFDMTFGAKNLGAGDDAENTTYFQTYSYATLEQALYATDTGAGSTAAQQTAAASLPTTDPSGGTGKYWITNDEARTLGLYTPASYPDESHIYLNSSLTYTYTSAGGSTGGVIQPGTYDAVGALEHEMTEVLGRTAEGGNDAFKDGGPDFGMLDLFRYTAAGGGTSVQPPNTATGTRAFAAQGFNGTDQTYFSLDGKHVELPYDSATDVKNGADVADWLFPSEGGPSGDSFGAGDTGTAGLISPTDEDELQAMGYNFVCYASGTRILTTRDEVAVESLAIGDLVITATGQARPIRWLGHRTVDCRTHPRRREALPIRISAHAIAENRPARDLYVSPLHSICVDAAGEVLIPAAYLANGATIAQVEVDEVTYWHVELDSHDLLVAEGLPAESYLDMGNRGFFAESGVVDLTAGPDGKAWPTHADFCRPFHGEGMVVDFVRGRLLARAEALGWRLDVADPLAGLWLEVDGARVAVRRRGLLAAASLPASAREVWLCSDAAVPAEIHSGTDERRLGVQLATVTLDDGVDCWREIACTDERLVEGFHPHEGSLRWTDGRGRLPSELWADAAGTLELRLAFAGPALSRWRAPAPEAAVLEDDATRAA